MGENYECKLCGKKEKGAADGGVPECCDQPMQKEELLPFCTVSETAEHSRMDLLDEPCDDGRTGKI